MANFDITIKNPKAFGLTSTGDTIQATVELDARQTIAGHFLILDHIDMDIVIMPKERKVVTFPKKNMNEHVYDAQNRLFHFLARRGIVDRDSVQGGNVYGAIEGVLAKSIDEAVDPLQLAIYSISRYMDKERPHFMFPKDFDDYLESEMSDPPPDESTALGKVPQEPRKGSMSSYARPFDLMYKLYEQQED
jgi:hypothetical protein